MAGAAMVVRSNNGEMTMEISDQDVLGLFTGGRANVRNRNRRRARPHIGDFGKFLSQIAPLGSTSLVTRDATANSSTRTNEHPLLSVGDSRSRNRYSQGGQRSQWMIDAFFSVADGRANHDNSDISRHVSSGSQRRRAFRAQLSDRRWGVDVGNLDFLDLEDRNFGGALEESLDDCLEQLIEKKKSAKSNRSTNIKESEEPTSPSRSPRSNMEEVKETEVSDENMDITDAISVTERSTEVTSEAVREIPASAEGTDNTIGLENASAASISENQSANGETAPGMFDLSFISNPSAIDSTDPADGPSAPNTSIDSASVVMEVSSFSTNDTSGQVVSSTNLDSTEANDTDGGTASVPTTTVPAPATETIERCPPNVDPEIWRELPEDVRSEILATEGDSGDMIENTELDREVLDALPVDVRNEVLLQEQSQRRIRGASITNAPTDHEANASGSGAGDNGSALSTSDGVQAPVLTVPRAPVKCTRMLSS